MGMFGLGLILEDDEFKISAGDDKEDDTTVDPEADDTADTDNTDDTTTPEDDTESSGDTEPVDDEDNDDFTISARDDDTDTEDNADGEENTGDDTPEDNTDGEEDTGDDTPEDGEEEDPSTKMYDSLSDQDKENKNVALKGNYRELYMNCDSIIEKLNDIPKEIDNNAIVGNVISSLSDLKSYIEYYLANNFNNRTFIENDIMFNKYLSILNGIKNVIKDIQILIEL